MKRLLLTSRTLFFLTCLMISLSEGLFAQCQTDIDFNTWSQEGFSANGSWNVQGGGTSVFQTINGDPSFYVSPDTFINVRIEGKIRIEDNVIFDDDFVGFVFGYREPDAIPTQYDLWLFDWKREEQTKGAGGIYVAQEGYTLSRISGSILAGNNNYWPNFWAHDSSATCTPIGTDYGFNKGWNTFTDYNFTLLYTPTRTTILVNNDTIFDFPGCFEPGRFGFYNYSQPNVRYSDFSYTLISNFEAENSEYDRCVSDQINFLFTDSTCTGGTSIANNIATWSWDFGDGSASGQTNPAHVFNLPGTYDVKLVVTDVNGCQDSITKAVVVHPPPIISLAADSLFCPVDSVNLIASGGVSYLWQPTIGLSDPTIANPLAFPSVSTTYTVMVTDQYGCEADTSVRVQYFNASIDAGLVICEGDTAMLGAGGGISYSWSPATNLINPMLPNPLAFPATTTTYQAVVIDDQGCEDTVLQTVLVNPRPSLVAGPDTSVCAGYPIPFFVSGANSYSWWDETGTLIGSGATPTMSFDSAATVYVIGIDGNGCENIDSVQIDILPPPLVDAGSDQFICSYDTVNIGTLANPMGSYNWSPGNLLNDPGLLIPTFDPPAAGSFDFTLTLTDQNGCVDSAQMTVTVHPFDLAINQTDVPCFGENTGTSELVLTATAPYTFSWLDSLGMLISQSTGNTGTATYDSLAAGNYFGVAIDSFGCTDTIPFQVGEPPAPLSLNVDSLMNVDCFGNANGEIHVSAAGGTPVYQYSITGGFTFNSSGIFDGLGAAIYTILVLDSNLCEASVTDTIQTPTGLFAQITTLRHIDCFGANNGALALVGQGGAPPYQYSLDNINFSNSLSVNNLAPGQDTVYFFDSNGCQVTLPFEIFEPPQFFSSITDIKGIDCFGNDNGQIWISSSGGTAPYQFSLDSLSFQMDSTFANLPGGMDTLIVQDDSLCTIAIPFTITEPAPLQISIADQVNIDCFGNATGSIVLSANGGIPAYQYSLDSMASQSDSVFTGLIAGSYTITVEDDSSCLDQISTVLTEPSQLILSPSQQINVDCFGNNSGSVQLSGNGGTFPYVFSMDSSNFQPDSMFQNLGAGNYSFWIQDDSNCVERIDLTITEPALLEIQVAEQNDVDCFGNDNGSIALTISGGVQPFLFSLDGGPMQSDSLFDNLIPGNHSIVVQDDSLCSNQLEVNIFEPPLLEISVSHTDVRCFGFDDGTGTVQIIGGTPAYNVLWDSPIPQSNTTAEGLGPGTYQVIVTDDNGCAETASIEVFEPDSLTLVIVEGSYVEAYCNWANGEAAVIAAGGLEPYSYRWEGPTIREGPAVNMLFGDTTYTAIVTDMNGCETAIPVFIPQTPPATPIIASEPSFEDSVLLSQANVQFINQSIGAVAYQWDFGDGTISDEENPLHSYLETGVYEVKLTTFNSYFVCPTDTVVRLHIIPDGALFVPSAFSPNDDGRNDFFFSVGEGLVDYELSIYNRWGNHITTLSNLSEEWDGRNKNGLPVPEGVYVYRVQAVLNDGKVINRGGSVTLIR